MANYQLVHCLDAQHMHGLHGYKDVIDTVQWGLRQLGHEAGYSINEPAPDAVNIVFGAQILSPERLGAFPDGTIIYNFEQIRGLSPTQLKPSLRYGASRFRIWDYSAANLQAWTALGDVDVRIAPVGYAPVLSRMVKAEPQDIDVLMYGLTGRKRLAAFDALSACGLTAVYVSGLYGPARDGLIERSKVILNINLYDHAKIFEIVRCSYLLANRKAVVSEIEPEAYIEDDIRSGIVFAERRDVVAQCLDLARNDERRAALEEAGFQAMSRRDIRAILTSALEP
jgi:hypothetical protein